MFGSQHAFLYQYYRNVDTMNEASTQTDLLPPKTDRQTSSQELKHITVSSNLLQHSVSIWFKFNIVFCSVQIQTEPFFNTATPSKNDDDLRESLRRLMPIMEQELSKCNTHVFKF